MWYLCFDFYDEFGYGALGGMGDCVKRTKDFHEARSWLRSHCHYSVLCDRVYIYDVNNDKYIYPKNIEEKFDNYKGNRPSYI